MRFICLTVVLLTGCGSMKEGFEKGFDKSFAESCRTETMKSGADQKLADKYCDCALAKFKETKSMDKAAEACAAQVRSTPN
jgi:hypothetical protein